MGVRDDSDTELVYRRSLGGDTLAVAPAEADAGAFELEPGAQVAEYQVVRALGRGGMGAVYQVVHSVIGKKAAIKVLHGGVTARAVERLVQEARAVNRVGHGNIVDVYSFGTLSDGRPYIVMEFLDGQALDSRIANRRLEVAEALAVVDQMTDALEAAHALGVVHRDLKPANVFLRQRGEEMQVKLLDFGLAKLVDGEASTDVQTAEGVILGTPAYLAPEQAAGRSITPKTDVYALGVMLFEMLVGCRPFYASSSVEVAYKHLHEPAPRPSELGLSLPAALDDLVWQMMSKQPEARPSITEVRAAVAQIRAEEPDARTVGDEPARRRRRLWMTCAAVALVVGIAAGLLLFPRGGDATPSSPAALPPSSRARAAPPPRAAAPQIEPSASPANSPAAATAPAAAIAPANAELPRAPRGKPASSAARREAARRARTRQPDKPKTGGDTRPVVPSSDDAPIDPLTGLRQ